MPNILRLTSFLLLLLTLGPAAHAQELLAEVRVSLENVTVSDPTLINQMQNDMQAFLNNRNFTRETYRPEERIKVRMFLGIREIPVNGTYKGTMRLISTRPVYGTGYETNVVNFTDNNFTFNYSPQNPLDYSPNSFVSNLSSLLAYYANLVIAIDHDTFAPLGGTPYYDQARAIINYSANQTTTNEQDEGWRDSGTRNRYWLLNNLTDPQLAAFRSGFYDYYRQGLDKFVQKPDEARASIFKALDGIQKAVLVKPNQLFYKAFFDTKADEVANIFRTSTDQSQKQKVVSMLSEVDATNTAKYQTILK